MVELVRMLPFVDQMEKAARLPQLQNTVEAMKSLVEDASAFVVKYKSDNGPGGYSSTSNGARADPLYM